MCSQCAVVALAAVHLSENRLNADYVIVGAGSAGSVLAARLSEYPNNRVLLLEAGPSDRRFYVRMPLGYGKVYYDQNVNWKYETEPVPGLNNRTSYWPRGKVLGGSSSINAMVYVRGHPNDYEEWNSVASGWSWADVAPVFKRMEDWADGEDEYRGQGGPLSVTNIKHDAHPLCQRYLDAAQQCQIPTNPDYNGASMHGASLYQINTRQGLRASASVCYLRDAMKRPNLTVLTGATATRIHIDNRRVTELSFEDKRGNHRVNVSKELIVSAGAINSPALLQWSGIGDEQLLSELGVQVAHASPHVGQHLQDHLGGDMVCRTNVPSLNQELRPWYGKLKVGLQFLLNRSGPLTLSLNQAGGFINVKGDKLTTGFASNELGSSDNDAVGYMPVSQQRYGQTPDLQLYFSPVSYTRAPPGVRPLINPDPFPGFLIGYNPCKPTSKGSVRITSAQANSPLSLQPNYLSTEYDRDLMLSGMRLMRQLLAAPALQAVVDKELLPGDDVESDDALMEYVRNNAWTVFHQCGTCRMGDNPAEAVVDSRLRVHGLAGLRVADASVFPTIPTGNTNAPSIMIGERASDFILQDNHEH